MSQSEPLDSDDDKPLDPAVERVRRKLARLMIVSVGIMLVGVMAVLGAVVYKVTEPDAEESVVDAIVLPAGAEIAGHSFSEGVATFLLDMPDGSTRFVAVPVGTFSGPIDIPVLRAP